MAHDTNQINTASTASSLEALFPRIAAALCDAWNTPEIEQHLQALLIDNRSTRLGFPAEVIEELMSLDGLLWELSDKRKRFLNTPDDADFSFGR
jgi:hypothetical protein